MAVGVNSGANGFVVQSYGKTSVFVVSLNDCNIGIETTAWMHPKHIETDSD